MDYEKAYKDIMKDIDHAIAGTYNEQTKIVLENIKQRNAESEDERIRTRLIALVEAFGQGKHKDEMLAYLERQKEHKLPEPEYGGENKQYPTEYRMDQDTRKKLIALVEKFGQEEDKDEMLDYLESYQPVQSASEVKEFNFQPGDPDEKAIKRLKAMIYFAFDETSEVPMDEACALDDWLDDKCKPAVLEEQKPAEWSKEDNMHLTNAILAAEKAWGTESYTVKWLKSLRSFWKPSKDEITAIEVAVKYLLAHTSDEQLRENVTSAFRHLKQL